MLNKNRITKFFDYLTEKRRARYLLNKQKRLKNPAPTIIGNNCVCGAIYRDLGLPYSSPTANVLIPPTDFLRFASDLEYYLKCVPEEVIMEKGSVIENATFPAGVLKKGEEQVLIIFMHDKTFEEGKEKWLRRCKRVDMNNLYIVFQLIFSKQKPFLRKRNSWYKEFKAIPHQNKRFLLNSCISFDKEIVPLRNMIFGKPSSTLEYRCRFSKKRWMDDFNYVKFLNQNQMRG